MRPDHPGRLDAEDIAAIVLKGSTRGEEVILTDRLGRAAPTARSASPGAAYDRMCGPGQARRRAGATRDAVP